MTEDEFNRQFSPLRVVFMSRHEGKMPQGFNPLKFQDRVLDLLALAEEHTAITGYLVALYWHSQFIEEFACTQAEFESETIPAAVLTVANTFNPDQL